MCLLFKRATDFHRDIWRIIQTINCLLWCWKAFRVPTTSSPWFQNRAFRIFLCPFGKGSAGTFHGPRFEEKTCAFLWFWEIEVVHDFFSLRGKGTMFFFCSNWLKLLCFWMAGFLGPAVSGKLQTKSGPNPRRKKKPPLHGLKNVKSAVPKWQEMLSWRTQKVQAMLQTCPSCKMCWFFVGGWTGLTGFLLGQMFIKIPGFYFGFWAAQNIFQNSRTSHGSHQPSLMIS